MKRITLGTLSALGMIVLAVACGKQDNPPAANPCAHQPGATWNGATCVYNNGLYGKNGYGGYNQQCANQPGTVFNGTQCVYGGAGAGAGAGGYNSSCTAGMIYTYQGCLPQGYCPIGSAQSQMGCVQAMNINGGYGGMPGYGGAYGGAGGYGGGYGGGYPSYYSARPGFYIYGGF